MLQEIEAQPFRHHAELSANFKCDTVVVGSGITGLLLAKKLTDLGQRVVLLDENENLAYGASIKNHGWLHKGTVHAVSVKDKDQAKSIVQKLIYGHEFISSYARECIENPFEPVYVCTQDGNLAQSAVELWQEFEVGYQQISRKKFYELDSGINPQLPLSFFQSSDLRINNRILFQKLLTDIKSKGGSVLSGATYMHTEEDKVSISSQGKGFDIQANTFVYCTGAKLGQSYERLTGFNLNLTFWKSHLLLLPRFSPFSLVSLDRDGPIIINHREASVVNKGYDEVQVSYPDYSVDPKQINLTVDSLANFYPAIKDACQNPNYIACIKPSVNIFDQTRHSVDSQVVEPVRGHYFVLPGKMTEAPYVVDELIHTLYNRLDFSEIAQRPIDSSFDGGSTSRVTKLTNRTRYEYK